MTRLAPPSPAAVLAVLLPAAAQPALAADRATARGCCSPRRRTRGPPRGALRRVRPRSRARHRAHQPSVAGTRADPRLRREALRLRDAAGPVRRYRAADDDRLRGDAAGRQRRRRRRPVPAQQEQHEPRRDRPQRPRRAGRRGGRHSSHGPHNERRVGLGRAAGRPSSGFALDADVGRGPLRAHHQPRADGKRRACWRPRPAKFSADGFAGGLRHPRCRRARLDAPQPHAGTPSRSRPGGRRR